MRYIRVITCSIASASIALAGGLALATNIASVPSFTPLGFLVNGTESKARDVSDNGSVVAGISGSRNGPRAFRWTSSGMQDLGPAVSRNTAKGDISGDGLVVVGATGTASNPVTSDLAFRWTAGTGMVSLNSYLHSLGIDLTGWTLIEADAIIADGLTIVGYGIDEFGEPEAWLANLEP